MNFLISLIAVLALLLIAYVGAGTAKLEFLFGVLIPYAAIAAFVLGFVYRIMKWVKSPVPFRIPATAGQQKSLDFIRHQKYEAPQ
ncbi:MAG: menaquinol oxidoreductase, partial [candidate division Zixibacteria bacterium]|nr:menaquinol oxidoreductase [candidate division Zixibacteria bacterium]